MAMAAARWRVAGLLAAAVAAAGAAEAAAADEELCLPRHGAPSAGACAADDDQANVELLQVRHANPLVEPWSTEDLAEDMLNLTDDGGACSSYEDCAAKYSTAVQRALARPHPEHAAENASEADVEAHVESIRTCSLEDKKSKGCPLSKMPRDKTTWVLPGGKTRCLFSTSQAYRFRVIPGDPEKLLFYLQEGGSCYDRMTTLQMPACRQDISRARNTGIFDRNAKGNPFADYTILEVTYCSGDMHIGRTENRYKDRAGRPVVQHGYWNTLAALDWAHEWMPDLEHLVMAGASAGSSGMNIWARAVLDRFHGHVRGHQAVFMDSYVGILPSRGRAFLSKKYSLCDLPVLTKETREKCSKGDIAAIYPDAILQETMRAYPHVVFAYITTKADLVQIRFHNVLALKVGQPLTSTKLLNFQINQLLTKLNEHPNFVSYLVNGMDHTFLDEPWLYAANTCGARGPRCSKALLPMIKWLQGFVLPPCGSVASQCFGKRLKRPHWWGEWFCAAELAGKEFTSGGMCKKKED